ncbi:MAG: GMP/IMP nucleotidase [Rhodocyclaceae bacterium]|nr:GMP/IMP nucleotidase [Rhodocyclaceae bacterium]
MIDWSTIDTVLLDMDGTLLDLHFDNHFWQEHVPMRYAERHGIPHAEARTRLAEVYHAKAGTLDWYCVDFWTRTLQLDIARLKEEVAHLIAVHPDVPEFLAALREQGKRALLVTNAHHKSLSLKMARTGLAAHFDSLITSHEVGLPKEDTAFWDALAALHPFDPARTLLIDDSLPVLRSARQAGIARQLAIYRPDSRQPQKDVGEFAAIRRFAEIMPRTPPAGQTIEFLLSTVLSSSFMSKETRENAMQGLMQNMPLMISSLIRHADQNHGDAEIVSRETHGGVHRYTYRDAHRRARRLARALLALGVKPSDRIASLAWNNYRHFELYYGVSGMGAILNTVNPRLFPEQITYIINHADDGYVFFDITFTQLVEAVAPHCKSVKGLVALTDRAHMPQSKLPNLLCYEELINSHSDDYEWPEFDENTASSLCYTSGTTGNPKGALYSHRSTILHAFGAALPDALNLSARDTVLPVVPLFHVNAWGLPYSAALTGARLVMPGPNLDGASLHELFEQEKVTLSAGVPTVWLGLLQHLQGKGLKLSTVKRLVIGGSAAPPAMIRSFDEQYGVTVLHAWGMTEMSPLGTVNTFKSKHLGLSAAEKDAIRLKQGRAIYGVEMKIVDDENKPLPHDGKAFGDLLVRGPWIVSGYFKDEGGSPLRADEHGHGWFPTGDVATLDPDGYMQITDRSKDVIKSGGEWISSIDLENTAVAHPAVAEAAVIGVAHPKWDERPLLLIVKKSGQEVTREQLLDFMRDKIAKWWLPDDVVFVDSLPHTATGKLLKTKLREEFRNHKLPTA